MKSPNTQLSSPQVSRCKHCAGKIYWDKTADGKRFPRNVYADDGRHFIAWGRPRWHDCLTAQKTRQDIAFAKATNLAAEISDLEIELQNLEREFSEAGGNTERHEIMALVLRGTRRQLEAKKVFLRDTKHEIECRQELLATR